MSETLYGDIWTLGFWANFPDPEKVLLGEIVGDTVGNLHVSNIDDYKWYSVCFVKNGKYIEGLSPVVVMYKSIETGLDISPVPEISELGGGIYKFEANPTVPMVVKIDSGDISMCDLERYKVFTISQYDGYLDLKLGDVKNVVDDIDEKLGEPIEGSISGDIEAIGGKIVDGVLND